ncbi:YihY/virulence factor BrkB family protein [Homoserinibacter sp. GY 40078]|uniref:YihY/virulence factor BrkB family protein n=1 Tax=Homoserinibacter sp. GY 40078 TaxID=2603275 RepID=UPI0011CB73DE|nr:YihY/virulence factor BrkB family protein [Homoserinibacter sp. GY 40078]TXK18413.1 YihY/virulence factor BrkB family protein [Homoserinibacter sp. GY 40078]
MTSSATTDTEDESDDKPGLVDRVKAIIAWVIQWKPVRVFTTYGQQRGPLLAAGLSNQAIFAVFAAIWVAFSVFGIVVAGRPALQDAILGIIADAVPGLIDTGEGGAIDPALLIDTSVLTWTGAVALVGLFFTALGWLASARDAVRELGELPAPRMNPVLLKLKDLGLAIGFGALLLLSAALNVLSSQALDGVLGWFGIQESVWSSVSTRALSIVLMFALDTVVLGALYRVLAGVKIPMRYLAQGALIGAFGLAVLKFLGNSLLGGATSNPLLASFAVIIGLLIWFTLVCQVILIAACWIFVSMRDAGVPLDAQLAAERREAEEERRKEIREEVRAELEAERPRGLLGRIFGRRRR